MEKMIEAYKKLWRNYTNFNGRSTVGDYWWAVLCNFIVVFVVSFLSGLLGGGIAKLFSVVIALYSLALIVPGLAICVRRLHDINKSGWFILIGLIPAVGGIILLVFMCMSSVDEGNQYGPIAE